MNKKKGFPGKKDNKCKCSKAGMSVWHLKIDFNESVLMRRCVLPFSLISNTINIKVSITHNLYFQRKFIRIQFTNLESHLL